MTDALDLMTASPWAIAPHVFDALLPIAHTLAAGKAPPGMRAAVPARIRRFTPSAAAARPVKLAGKPKAGAVVVVPVHGLLLPRGASLLSGPSTSSHAMSRELARLAADPDVATVVLDVDTTGGSVFGVQELADALAKVRERKQLVAVANGMAVSGGYWVASQAHELVVTPSGQVGGLGVVMAHMDTSAMRQRIGVQTEYISAGRFKSEGFRDGPLTKDHRAHLQSMVDTYYRAFVDAVARGRGAQRAAVLGPAFGEGRVRMAADAVAYGMADRVATLAQVLLRLDVSQDAINVQHRQLSARDADIAIATLH